MGRYWVYLNDEVVGPYEIEHLIRLRGFSRQTRVCVEDTSGKPMQWISPAEIPELAHIFKAADEHLAAPPSAPSPRVSPKPVPARSSVKSAPAAAAVPVRARRLSYAWIWWILGLALLGSGGWYVAQRFLHDAQAQEQVTAKSLVDQARLPSASLYATLGQYFDEKGIKPRWEFERTQEALYHVMVSWATRDGASVLAFETNIRVQTVRGINTAAIRLLNEGFPGSPAGKSKSPSTKKKAPVELFPEALESYRQSLESADFQAVWNTFSPRKKTEMAKGGMSRDGYIRLQSLTHHVDQPVRQSLVKTKVDSDKSMLVLMKQTQSGRPDLFVKQVWIFADGEWKLDDEEKHATAAPAAATVPAESVAPTTQTTPSPSVPQPKPSPASLPGMSN